MIFQDIYAVLLCTIFNMVVTVKNKEFSEFQTLSESRRMHPKYKHPESSTPKSINIQLFKINSSFIIEDVRKHYENFQEREKIYSGETYYHEEELTQGTEAPEYEEMLNEFMMREMITEYNFHHDRSTFFKAFYVSYLAAEYVCALFLCRIQHAITEYTRPKYWYTKVLKENFIFSNCEDVISRFQEIITVYEEAVSELQCLPPRNHEEFNYIYNSNEHSFADSVNILMTYVRMLNEFNNKFDIVLATCKFLYPGSSKNECKCMYNNLQQGVSKYRKYLAKYVKQFDIDTPSIIHDPEDFNQETLIISENVWSTWRFTVSLVRSNSDMSSLQFLSRCEELRNEIKYYKIGLIEQIYPVEILRAYKYPDYKLIWNMGARQNIADKELVIEASNVQKEFSFNIIEKNQNSSTVK